MKQTATIITSERNITVSSTVKIDGIEYHVGVISLPNSAKHKALAERLSKCIEDGHAYPRPQIKYTTTFPKRLYLECKANVIGKYLDDCLTELGY